MNPLKKYDFLIVGSGFGGSILAMCLAQSGYEVCLVERGEHPRFAIGESSTPIADMILRDLADRFNFPFLKEISRYGDWQKHHPEIICGLKRGFSYYSHQKGEEFTSDRMHSNELLVAASVDNKNSDTNWLRFDVDHFLVKQLQGTGVDYFDRTMISNIERSGKQWKIAADKEGDEIKLNTRWIIDATGSSRFSERFLGTTSSADGFHANSFAVYSHFESADYWLDYLNQHGFYTEDYPYNPDHSALHQVIDEGWIWMLRFNNGLLSSGLVIDSDNNPGLAGKRSDEIWPDIMNNYPSLLKLFRTAVRASSPGKLIKTERLQRKLNTLFGDGWIALNHTAGFVDPLHSTGIAHTLTGIEKIVNLFNAGLTDNEIAKALQTIQTTYNKELEMIDLLVSSCYKARGDFRLFSATVMLYFAASIKYEQERLGGSIPESFLCSSDQQLFDMISTTHSDIENVRQSGFPKNEADKLIEKIRERIAPYNSVGLMDDSKRNMYQHTAVTL